MRFTISGTGGSRSGWYNISNIAFQKLLVGNVTRNHYVINIDEYFGDDLIPFVGSGATIADIKAGIEVEIAKKTIENRPEFDGRFFVKIERDDELKKALGLETSVTINTVWNNVASFESVFLYGAANNPTPYCDSSWTVLSGGNHGVTTAYDNSIYPGWLMHGGNRRLTYALGTSNGYGCPTFGGYNGGIFPDADGGAGWGNGNTITNSAAAMGPPPTSGLDPCDQVNFSPPFRVETHWDNLYSLHGAAGEQGFWFIDSEPALSDAHVLVAGHAGTSSSAHAFKMAAHGKGADIGSHNITLSLAGAEGGYNWTNQFNVPTPQEDTYDRLTTVGTRFRFSNDPDGIVYEINSFTEENVYN